MKRLARFALRFFYPKRWRARYGREFEALIEDLPASLGAFVDVLRGGIVMQVRTWSYGRAFAAVAVAAGLVLAAAILALPRVYRSEATIAIRGEQNGALEVKIRVDGLDRDATLAANRELVSTMMDDSLQRALHPDAKAETIEIVRTPSASRGPIEWRWPFLEFPPHLQMLRH